MKPTRIAPLLLLPVALAGCGRDAADVAVADPPAVPVTSAPVPAVPVATATAPPASPSARATSAPKPEPEAAGTTSRATSARVPRAEVAGRSDSLSTGRWTLRVTLASGDVVTGAVVAEPQVRPGVLGVVDADRDGDHEVLVSVGGGASTTTYAVFTLVEDGMAEVRHAGGRPLRLVAGGTVTHGDGFICETRALVVLSAVSDDGETFRGTSVTYAWRDDVVTETARRSFTGRSGDPAVRSAYGVDCWSVQRG